MTKPKEIQKQIQELELKLSENMRQEDRLLKAKNKITKQINELRKSCKHSWGKYYLTGVDHGTCYGQAYALEIHTSKCIYCHKAKTRKKNADGEWLREAVIKD